MGYETAYAGSKFQSSKRRRFESSSKQRCIWSCEICGYAHNTDHAISCCMCNHKGPVTRFGVKINGLSYLCSVHSARPPQKVDLLRATMARDGSLLEMVLDGTSELPLANRIIRTLVREIGGTQKIRDEIVAKLKGVLQVS